MDFKLTFNLANTVKAQNAQLISNRKIRILEKF